MGRYLAVSKQLSGVLNTIRFDAWFASPLFCLSAAVMVASLMLGGGTRVGFLSDAVLQLLSIPLLLVALSRLFQVELTKEMRLALWFCAAIVALPFVQLIPLPPWLWTSLPNRQPSAEAFQILGQAVPWMPISVSPNATWLSALSLVPPLAIFLGTILLAYRERRLLSLIVLVVGISSVFIGLLQIAQGPNSALRFFEFTNQYEAVGFFANRNHFAALIYCLILFAIAWSIYLTSVFTTQAGHKQHSFSVAPSVASILVAMGGLTVLVLLLSGEVMARSRAGLGLAIVSLFGAVALGFSARNSRSNISPNKLVLGAIVVAVTFSLQFALFRALERFAADPLENARLVFARNTAEAAKAYMPVGSGLGTFVPVYAMFEKPQDTAEAYVNHAHNDFLELWLESGAIGVVLIALFVIWVIWRSVKIWRSPRPIGASDIDLSLARAATIVIALITVHSFFDYPLRTGAMMAIMAFATALLIEPPSAPDRGSDYAQTKVSRRRTRYRDEEKLVAELAARHGVKPRRSSISNAPPRGPNREEWGADIKWPKEWSDPSK